MNIKSFLISRYMASCVRKRKYNIITVLIRYVDLKIKGEKVNIYKCKYCKKYHVGRLRKKSRIKKLDNTDFSNIKFQIDKNKKLEIQFVN